MLWTRRSKAGAPGSAAGFGRGSGQSVSPCAPRTLSRSPGKAKGRVRLWLLGSRGSLLAVLDLPSPHAGQAGEPPGQHCGRAAALSPVWATGGTRVRARRGLFISPAFPPPRSPAAGSPGAAGSTAGE